MSVSLNSFCFFILAYCFFFPFILVYLYGLFKRGIVTKSLLPVGWSLVECNPILCLFFNIQGPVRGCGYWIHKKDQEHILDKGKCGWLDLLSRERGGIWYE